MNYLFTCAGRRFELLKLFKRDLKESRLVATDSRPHAPALQAADRSYLVPPVYDPDYLSCLLEICKRESIDAIFPLIDSEIPLLARRVKLFQDQGVTVFVPNVDSADRCHDKFAFYQYLTEQGIPTIMTYGTLVEAKAALTRGALTFPLFVKPRYGSGGIGAWTIHSISEIEVAFADEATLIVQPFIQGEDIGVDAFVDALSHKLVSAFMKKKLELTIGGANKTISFWDERLFFLIDKLCQLFSFVGPIDIDLFCQDGVYYVTEINPRFGGGYLHADGAGVNFLPLIENNLKGIKNEPYYGEYADNLVMMMYDAVVFQEQSSLVDVDLTSG